MVFFFLFFLFFFPSTTDTPCHPDGVPRTRGDEGSSASAPFILTLALYSCSLLSSSLLLLLTVFLSLRFSASSNHPNISTNSFCTLWPLSLLYQFCNSIFCFSKSAFSALSCS